MGAALSRHLRHASTAHHREDSTSHRSPDGWPAPSSADGASQYPAIYLPEQAHPAPELLQASAPRAARRNTASFSIPLSNGKRIRPAATFVAAGPDQQSAEPIGIQLRRIEDDAGIRAPAA